MKRDLEAQAIEALKAALQDVSVIKLREIRTESGGRKGGKNITADIDIYGHHRVLVCKVKDSSEIVRVKRGLRELRALTKNHGKEMTPIFIAPMLSDEAQTLCREKDSSFLDLAGNARLMISEVFIVKHSMPHHKRLPPSAESLPTSETTRFAIA